MNQKTTKDFEQKLEDKRQEAVKNNRYEDFRKEFEDVFEKVVEDNMANK